MTYKLSIIIPCYNVENHLENTLKSIFSQLNNDLEIILINDGSKDNTINIIREYHLKYPNIIRYFDTKNNGVSSARNLGIKVAKGEFIYFLDADDYLESNILNKWINFIESNKLDICFGGYKVIDYDSKKCKFENCNFTNDIMSGIDILIFRLMKKIWILPGNAIYSNQLIKKNNISYNELLSYGEDAEFIGQCLYYSDRVASLNKTVLNSVNRKNSAMSNISFSKYKDALQANINIQKLMQNDLSKQNSKLDKALRFDYMNLYLGVIKVLFCEHKHYNKKLFVEVNKITKPNWDLKILSFQKKIESILFMHFPYIYFYITKIYKIKKHV